MRPTRHVLRDLLTGQPLLELDPALGLSDSEARVLAFVCRRALQRPGVGATVREVAAAMGWASTGGAWVQHILRTLEAKGLVRRGRGGDGRPHAAAILPGPAGVRWVRAREAPGDSPAPDVIAPLPPPPPAG